MLIFTTADLFSALEILIMGWGGIFLVMGVLYLAIKVLLKAFPPEDDEE